MKLLSKDMLNIPSTVFCLMFGIELIGFTNLYADSLSRGSYYLLLGCIAWAWVSVLCNAILAFKVIKLNAIERTKY